LFFVFYFLFLISYLGCGFRLRSLGLDVGDRRIGIAVSDPLGMLARPFSVLERRADMADIAVILDLVKEKQVGIIIVGLPVSINGSLGTQVEKVRRFAEQLRSATAIPLEYRDESYSTLTAKDLLESRGKKKKGFVKKGEYDAAAAAVILQSYLNESCPVSFPSVEE
jgi:putative holliday junction resolvase